MTTKKLFAARVLMSLMMLMAPAMTMWGQEVNEKFSMTTQMLLNELKMKADQPTAASRRAHVRRMPDGKVRPRQRRLIASPDTVGGVAYISCFVHLKDAADLSAVCALGVEVEESFDGLDFVTARVPVDQLEPLAGLDNVTRIKVARRMRPLTDAARQTTNVDDLLTESPDALALGVTSQYDGTGVVLGVIDTGIDFQHAAFKDKDGNSRIKRAYVYNGKEAKEYDAITSNAPTTDDKAEDHGTHTASTAGGSSVIVSGQTVNVTDDHANATYGGMAPGADLYLAGVNGLEDTYLTNALKNMVTYADAQNKPLVVSNSWGSGWGPRDGTGEYATLVSQYFGKSHPNRVILFAASNDAGHRTGDEGGGFFVRKSSANNSSPLGTIIRTDGEGGDLYEGLMACAWSAQKLNCILYVLDKNGTVKKSWTVTSTKESFSGLSTYYDGSMAVYIEQENGKWQLSVYSGDVLNTEKDGAYTLAIEVFPSSGSGDVNMWAGDWSYFTSHLTTSGHTWTAGTDDMCVSDEATISDAISVGAYVSKTDWKASSGTSYSSTDTYTMGDIAYFSSYATAEYSPIGKAYPWISAPGARLAAGVNHYHTKKVDDYSYFSTDYINDLVVNSSSSPYAMMEGTSMATPVAAGIVALWLQASLEENAKHKNLTVNDVKNIMRETAISDSYTTTGANASHFGHGKIDALAGIQYILGTTGSPVIKATPKTIDFGSSNFSTKTYTKTLNVRGFNLDDNVNLNLSDNANFTLSRTSITQSEAADGVDITITYAPQDAGTHKASITLSSPNAADVAVPLTAAAKPATPTIIAEPATLAFSAGLNELKSLSVGVLSEFLTDDVSVALADANGVFSIDKRSVTKAETEEGATVTVTFKSAAAGTYTGTVTLSSPGAESVTVNLSATVSVISDETIDFTKQGYTNAQDVTSVSGTGCTVTFGKGTNSNSPKYYSTGDAIRLYGSNTMTVAVTGKTIEKIELTFGTGDGSNSITTDVATYSKGTWTGSASSVRFTVGGTSGHRRIQKVKVTYSGGGSTPIDPPVDPTMAYYQSADGQKGKVLKTALCGIIYNRTEQGYNSLWTAFRTTDVKSNGKIWDMYSNITGYEPGGSAQGANYSGEGDSYNREHSFPQSWFGGDVKPMCTDLHHIYPTDGFVNNKRANYPFGETSSPTYTSANNFSKLGTCTWPGYTGTVFEPADEYKGDFARTYFYMVTCYEEKLPDWYSKYSESQPTLDGNTYPGLSEWQLDMLLKWAKDDPVSEKETNRNNAVYAIQKNRNPFIDYPGLEEYVWGSLTAVAFSYDNYLPPVFMSFSPTAATATIGESFTAPTLTTSPAGVAVTYSSSDETVATVDESTGEVTLLTAGTTVITATYDGDDNSNGGSASYTLTVLAASTPGPGPVVGSGNYTLVTDAATLKAGDKILIAYVNDNTKHVLSTTQNPNNRVATNDVTLNADGTLTPGSTAQVVTLEKDGSYYLFNVGNDYLYAASSSKNYLRTEEKADANAKASISISSGGSATISFKGSNKHNTIRYNPNNGSPIFSCYSSGTSTGSAPQVYRELPTPEVPKGDVDGDGDVDNVDIMLTVSHILGQNPAGFSKDAADMNGDNVVDITDLTAIIAAALQRPQP